MEFPINAVFQIKSQEELDAFQSILGFAPAAGSEDVHESYVSTFDDLKERMEYRRVDSSQEARVLISGQEVARGTTEEMLDRYNTECSMHSTSNIVCQEWVSGDWKVKRQRRLQTV